MKPRAQPDISHLVQLFGAGRFPELETAARALLKSHPRHGVAWKALGVALTKQGKNALDAMRKAAEFLPADAEAHFNLGVESQLRQQTDLAEASYRRSLALQPHNAHALNNLANILKEYGKLEEAEATYAKAVAANPAYPNTYYNLGLTMQDSGRWSEAEQCYREAIARRPDYASAYNNLGLVLARLERPQEAQTSYRTALQIDPKYVAAWINISDLLRNTQAYSDALAAAQRAVEISPESAEALVAYANLLCETGKTADGIERFEQALALNPDLLEAHDDLLFTMNYVESAQSVDTTARIKLAKRYGELVASRAKPFQDLVKVKDPEKVLRIGLVSGDLKAHPVGYFIDKVLQTLSQNHSDQLQLFAYSNTPREDDFTLRIKQHCASWVDVSNLSDAKTAERIHSDGIDILIDLSGHTAHNRLPVFAWKPAPVQATWLGYFATTGVKEIDYLIADPWTVPESDDADFTETVWRLPETRLCFTAPDASIEVGPLPALKEGHVTFGCFNNLGKMGPEVVALWVAILHAVPDSTLFLKAKQFGQAAIDDSVRAQFQAHGIAAQRLRIEGRSPRAQYLAAYNEVDIALDPFPFTGGTTTVEGLWMGVPALSLQGTRMIARQGASLLRNAGLADWIAESQEAYLRQAVARAADLPALSRLRAGLREQVLASPVFDAERFARHFAAAMRGMWQKWCESAVPSDSIR